MKINNLISLLLFFSLVFGQIARINLYKSISFTLLDITALIVFIYCSYLFLHKKILLKSINNLKYLGVFFIICFFSLILSPITLSSESFLVSISYLARLIIYTGFLVYAFSLRKDYRSNLIESISYALLIVSFLGIVQFIFFPDLSPISGNSWDIHLYRLFSVYLDPNFTGVILSIGFFIFLNFFINNFKKGIVSYKYIVFSSLIGLSVFLTFSRTALVVLLSGTLIMMIIHRRIKLLVGLIVISFSLLVILSDVSVEGLNPFRTVSTQARINSANIAVSIWSENKLTGIGFNAYRYAQNQLGYRVGGFWETSHADSSTDNSFLFVLATTGVLGFLFYIVFWASNLHIMLRKINNKLFYSQLGLAVVLSCVVGSMFLNIMFYTFSLCLLYILIGFSLGE